MAEGYRLTGQAEVRISYPYVMSLRTILTTSLCQICPWLNSTAVTGVTGSELHILTHTL